MKYLILVLTICALSDQLDCKQTTPAVQYSAVPYSTGDIIIRNLNKRNFITDHFGKFKDIFANTVKKQEKEKSFGNYNQGQFRPCFWKICSRPLNKHRYNKYYPKQVSIPFLIKYPEAFQQMHFQNFFMG